MESYLTQTGASGYENYLQSKQGKIQQEILWQAISKHMTEKQHHILDAGCGTGWLSKKLQTQFPACTISACDSSPLLIARAKEKNHPIDFLVADLGKQLPYSPQSFDVVIANMVLHDLPELSKSLTHMQTCLKDNGVIIATLPNPYYAYPVGIWKRGFSKLWNALPRLKVRSHIYFSSQNKKTAWHPAVSSFFYPLPLYFKAAQEAALYVELISDVYSTRDSSIFNLYYQLHRFPILWVLRFKKLGKQ